MLFVYKPIWRSRKEICFCDCSLNSILKSPSYTEFSLMWFCLRVFDLPSSFQMFSWITLLTQWPLWLNQNLHHSLICDVSAQTCRHTQTQWVLQSTQPHSPGVQTEILLSQCSWADCWSSALCPIVVLTVCSKAGLLAARLLHCLHAGREIELRLFGMLGSHHSSAFARLAEMLWKRERVSWRVVGRSLSYSHSVLFRLTSLQRWH